MILALWIAALIGYVVGYVVGLKQEKP